MEIRRWWKGGNGSIACWLERCPCFWKVCPVTRWWCWAGFIFISDDSAVPSVRGRMRPLQGPFPPITQGLEIESHDESEQLPTTKEGAEDHEFPKSLSYCRGTNLVYMKSASSQALCLPYFESFRTSSKIYSGRKALEEPLLSFFGKWNALFRNGSGFPSSARHQFYSEGEKRKWKLRGEMEEMRGRGYSRYTENGDF